MEILQTGPGVVDVLMWLRWADADYNAARLCLLNGLLVQGAAFSNTALEKYVKSLFAHRSLEVPSGHEVSSLYGKMKRESGSDLSVNESYLRLLQLAYKLRYPDDISDGFNIALNQVRLLVELDRTVLRLTERFEIKKNGEKVPLVLERAIRDNDQRILQHNAALNPHIASTLFATPSQSFDFRRHKGQTYEATYISKSVEDNADFELEGFKVLADYKFKVAYKPFQESKSAAVGGLEQQQV